MCVFLSFSIKKPAFFKFVFCYTSKRYLLTSKKGPSDKYQSSDETLYIIAICSRKIKNLFCFTQSLYFFSRYKFLYPYCNIKITLMHKYYFDSAFPAVHCFPQLREDFYNLDPKDSLTYCPECQFYHWFWGDNQQFPGLSETDRCPSCSDDLSNLFQLLWLY